MTSRILVGHVLDQLAALPDASVQCVITSPPYYGLRAYGTEPQTWPDGWRGELGQEPTLALFLAHLVQVFREVKRVLRDDGVCFVNMGDSYAGGGGFSATAPSTATSKSGKYGTTGALKAGGIKPHDGLKPKDLMMVPARLALALQADGWYLRSDIIWAKPNPMPESVTDRPTSAHEHIFLLTKSARYFYDAEAVKEENSGAPSWGGNVTDTKKASLAVGGVGATSMHQPMTYAEKMRYSTAGRNLRNVWTITTRGFSDWTQTCHQVPVAPGDADDDTSRITSPDCPIHAGQSDSVPMVEHGGHGAVAASRRNPDSDGRPALVPLFDSAPIDQHHGAGSAGESLGSPPLSYAPVATDHSSGNRKTDPDHGTSRPCSVSAQTTVHTDGTSTSPEPSDSAERSRESSISPDGLGDHPSAQTTSRTADMSSCTCSYYKTVTESISHFATFPPELPRRCILAGTSAHGCCAACGTPWRRVVERGAPRTLPPFRTGGGYVNQRGPQDNASRNSVPDGMAYKTVTTGWQPGCTCDAPVIPCTVLDPFSGAGTVGLVAEQLGRDSILVELNETYADMARERIQGAAPLLTTVELIAPVEGA